MNKPVTLTLLPVLLMTDPAAAQSLFQRPASGPVQSGPVSPAMAVEQGTASAGATATVARAGSPARLRLRDSSLYVVVPPEPKTFTKHDKVEIIINESAISKAQQTLDTKKRYNLQAELSQFPSLQALFLDSTLANGIGDVKPGLGVTATDNHKGEGKYERKDQLTARISAIVLDVKPNGHLVVEATETIQQDAEIKTMVLSGIVDPQDITNARTVQSSQIANLSIRLEHQGRVKDAGDKGLIPRVLESIFSF